MKEYIELIIIPYVDCKRKELKLSSDQPALATFDVFKGQQTEDITKLLEESNIKRGNVHVPYSVTIVDGNTVVGHVPRAISAVCLLFLRRNSVITCEVIGGRHYSNDLPQGGLEIPCKLEFSGKTLVQSHSRPVSTK